MTFLFNSLKASESKNNETDTKICCASAERNFHKFYFIHSRLRVSTVKKVQIKNCADFTRHAGI